ncbi:SDR family oxidoreductase [Plesiocystis pacifica]|uniref:SDR family oxidoreductase n=1 Tax=Plesiocystis pacifica TaxID=191768 RepID=UPI0002F1EF69|nr:SDR family oxidoreductase [Plesiocystis pacifica]
MDEKTGYPTDMLELSMEIEADMGIDSIKRVEILSTMRQRVPGLPEADPAKLASMRTLAEIAEALGAPAGGAPAAAAAAAPVAAAAPAPAAAPAAGANGVDLVAEMLEVVAEKTGYPADMLELGMEIEADLGIDSIKRVEILSTMRQRVPGLPEADPAKLASMRTLAEIVEALHVNPEMGAAEPSLVTAPASISDISSLARFVVRPRVVPAPGFASALFEARTIVVLPEGGDPSAPLAAGLVERLRGAGLPARVATDLDGVRDADAVIDLRALVPETSADAWAKANFDAFSLARALAPRFGEFGGTLVFVQDTGGDLGISGSAPGREGYAGIAGLAKTAALEWPTAEVRTIDLSYLSAARTADDAAAALFTELERGGLEREVGLAADGTRVTLEGALETVPGPTVPVTEGGVFVVSGGARGVTASALIELARTAPGRCKFLILGRTALAEEDPSLASASTDAELKRALMLAARSRGEAVSPRELGSQARRILANREVRANFAALRGYGSEVEYAAVDVRSVEQVRDAVASVRTRWGRVDGLIHGAGVLADASLQDKTDEGFLRVFETKVAGLRALLDATASDDLRWLCLFSSVAARGGNPGQSDYAMANEILNKAAAAEAARRGPSCAVSSIGWGPWAGGMVTPTLAAMFEARGVGLIPLDEGCQAFVAELGAGGPSEVVIGAGLELAPGEAQGYAGLARVHRGSAPQLDDHRVRGEVVLPIAMVLEWFVQLAQVELPSAPSWVFEDFRVLRGVVVSDYDAAPTTLRVVSQSAGEGLGVELTTVDGDGGRRHGARLRAGEGRLSAVEAASLPASPWAVSEVYAPGRLFHGPAFQAITSLEGLSEQGASALLQGYATSGVQWSPRRRPLDPVALDGMLQLGLLCGLARFGEPSLPLAIERCEILRAELDATEGPYRCELRVREASNQHTRCDAALIAADGRVVIRIEGLQMFALPRAQSAAAE